MIPGSATGAHPPATGPTPPQHGPVPTSGPPPHPGAPPTGPPTYPPQHPYQPNTQVLTVNISFLLLFLNFTRNLTEICCLIFRFWWRVHRLNE